MRKNANFIALKYKVIGDISQCVFPAPAHSERRDNLWQHSCFEAFIRDGDGQGYQEYNFSPSVQWAAYHFTGYRNGMTELDQVFSPEITTQYGADNFELRVVFAPVSCGALGLSAIIEEKSGRKSYWALAHPAGKADFHHPDCFAYQLSGV